MLKPFENPIYVTQPILADLNKINTRMQDIWNSKRLTNIGEQHKELEDKLKTVLKAPNLCLFNNGTIALMIACQSLELSGEVITTPFTFPATTHVLNWNNIKPVFCDIDPITLNIDADKIESLITPKTTAILGVHVYGNPCNVQKIQEIANKYSLKVIYDAAHAFGTEINGVGIGTFGDISMFSLHATKLFHTIEGGALTFNDQNLKNKIEFLKNFGIKNEEEVTMPGINGKMNEVQAAIGLANLEYIEDERAKRAKIISLYKQYLAEVRGIEFIPFPEGIINSMQYLVIRVKKQEFGSSRDELYEKLKTYNVMTRKYFYPLCSSYPCYSNLPSSNPSNLVIANQVVQEVLCLPLYGELKLEEVEQICLMINGVK